MRNILLSSLMLVLGLILSACLSTELSADVNQDRINTDYELAYNANRDVTVAFARFSFGSEALSLSNGSTVTFNGQQLSERPGLGSYYQLEVAGQVGSGTFVWTDANGTTYSNPVTLPTPVRLAADTGPLSRSQATTISWEGLPVQSNEFMALFPYRDDLGDFEIIYASTDVEGANSLIVTPDQLVGVAPGEVTLSLTRVRDLAVTNGTSAGGMIRGRYVALDLETQVVD